jgi:PhzF family phenazine biosynthesis protein
MKIPIYQIDAFASKLFSGNPAAVVPLDDWIDDKTMLAIAAENNLAETAFFVSGADSFDLRWFTPKFEVDLCGHATLASAWVIFNELGYGSDEIRFECKSGTLYVQRDGDLLSMDFPSWMPEVVPAPDGLIEALGVEPVEVLKSRDYLVAYGSEAEIKSINPDFGKLMKIDTLGVCVTSKGDDADFVSRFFAPRAGIPEDPVTGSTHSELTPYWAGKLAKTKLRALQLSERGGELFCEHLGDRVKIAGYAVKYLGGEIEV